MHARSIFISGERIFPFHRRIIQSNYSRIYSNRDIEKYFRNRHVSPLCMQNSSDYHSFVKRERDRKKGEEEKDTDAINKLLTLFRSTFLFSLYFYLSLSFSLTLCFIAFYYSHNRIWYGDSAGDFGFVYGNAVVGSTMPSLNVSLSARTDAHSKLPLAPSPPVIFRNQTIRAMRPCTLSRGPRYKSAYIIAHRRN